MIIYNIIKIYNKNIKIEKSNYMIIILLKRNKRNTLKLSNNRAISFLLNNLLWAIIIKIKLNKILSKQNYKILINKNKVISLFITKMIMIKTFKKIIFHQDFKNNNKIKIFKVFKTQINNKITTISTKIKNKSFKIFMI